MARARFTVEAGRFTRGQVRPQLSLLAWNLGLDIHFEEARGFWESVYHVTVEGNQEKLTRFHQQVKQLEETEE